MTETRIIMGMHITLEIVDPQVTSEIFEEIFSYFTSVDAQFSTYKDTSEIMRINRGEVSKDNCSSQMKEVFALAEKTKEQTVGFFDIKKPDGSLDPSGIVKGWSIQNAADLLLKKGYKNFYVDVGGDIQSHGLNGQGKEWSIGIRHPFKPADIIKVIYPHHKGVATSGTSVRGQHIYNPHMPEKKLLDIVSLTVIGPNILEADRFATAAFAMGKEGINFIEKLVGFEGYAIDHTGMATMTTNFEHYTKTQ
ncbi:MAG: FAD:protein FMN transferase [Candidatus Pacebacteria bacterium]|nr:FAD:protein FMN transferase [Candidatus Paceibacterota bacterium]